MNDSNMERAAWIVVATYIWMVVAIKYGEGGVDGGGDLVVALVERLQLLHHRPRRAVLDQAPAKLGRW